MRFTIRGENIEVTDAIRSYIEKRLSKLDKYFNEQPISDVRVNLKVFNNDQRIEVTIPMTDLLLRADVKDSDLYAAIDMAADKLERQIRKYKTKVNRKFRNEGSMKEIFIELEREANAAILEEEEDDSLDIVKTKRFTLKPMDSEEAVLQMDMLGHNFFVYEDAVSGATNVVYKRRDGRYGLIESN